MNLTLIMMQSLNGKIAMNQDDRLQWGSKADKKNYTILTKTKEVLIMASTTFDTLSADYLKSKKMVVLTREPQKYALDAKTYPNVKFTNQNPDQIYQDLKKSKHKEVALVGGSVANFLFLEAGLIDIINISISPIIFAQGTPLFADQKQVVAKLKLVEINKLDKNTINLVYKVQK